MITPNFGDEGPANSFGDPPFLLQQIIDADKSAERFEAANSAMNAIIAHSGPINPSETVATLAVRFADALLAELKK